MHQQNSGASDKKIIHKSKENKDFENIVFFMNYER